MELFDFEKLDVYRVAIDFLAVSAEVIEHLPRGRGHLADQLERASTSIVLNTAEGAGEFAPAEKARFYRMARRSATECAAILEVCRMRHLVEQVSLDAGREQLIRIVGMLTRMVSQLAKRATE